MVASFHHKSVLLSETVEALTSNRDGLFLDCTLGAGGHSESILLASEHNSVIGLDRDPFAIAAANHRLTSFTHRFESKQGPFADLLPEFPDQHFDGILMDLGV